jgi:hypothetical protein
MSSCATNVCPRYVTYGKVSNSCDTATMGSGAVLGTPQAPGPGKHDNAIEVVVNLVKFA